MDKVLKFFLLLLGLKVGSIRGSLPLDIFLWRTSRILRIREERFGKTSWCCSWNLLISWAEISNCSGSCYMSLTIWEESLVTQKRINQSSPFLKKLLIGRPLPKHWSSLPRLHDSWGHWSTWRLNVVRVEVWSKENCLVLAGSFEWGRQVWRRRNFIVDLKEVDFWTFYPFCPIYLLSHPSISQFDYPIPRCPILFNYLGRKFRKLREFLGESNSSKKSKMMRCDVNCAAETNLSIRSSSRLNNLDETAASVSISRSGLLFPER